MVFVFVWLTSLSTIISRSIHVAANGIVSFLFYGWVIAHFSQSPGIWEFSASFPDSPLPSLLAPTSTLLSSQGAHCVHSYVHPCPPWNALSSPLCQESTPTHPYTAHFTHHLSWGLNTIMLVKCLVYSQLWPNMNCIWSLGQKDPWRREWLPIPVFLPGESHGERNLVGYSLRGCKEMDTTEQLTFNLWRLKSRQIR